MLSFLPKFLFPRLTDITPDFLHREHISLLLMDFDNTMLPYTTDSPDAPLLTWIEQMQQAGIRLCIVSNSRRSRVPCFSEKYGLDCVTRAKKPFSKGIRIAMQRYGIGKAETALVGDQIFTDVLGANLAGIASLHVPSIHNHTFWLKLRHVFELPFLAMSKKRRVVL